MSLLRSAPPIAGCSLVADSASAATSPSSSASTSFGVKASHAAASAPIAPRVSVDADVPLTTTHPSSPRATSSHVSAAHPMTRFCGTRSPGWSNSSSLVANCIMTATRALTSFVGISLSVRATVWNDSGTELSVGEESADGQPTRPVCTKDDLVDDGLYICLKKRLRNRKKHEEKEPPR